MKKHTSKVTTGTPKRSDIPCAMGKLPPLLKPDLNHLDVVKMKNRKHPAMTRVMDAF